MPISTVGFPLSSSPGANPQEANGRLINCFAEPLGKAVGENKKDAPPAVVWRKNPGLTLFGASANSGPRGFQLVNNALFAAWNNKVSSFDSTGTETAISGTLNGTEKVFFARNNKTPTPDLVCVAPGTGGFIVTSSVSSWSAAGAPNSVSFMDSYFLLTYGDGTIQASDQNATTINTLNKTTAQSKPGGLTRGLAYGGKFYALGPLFGEVYTDTANPTGFPFNRSYVLQCGLLSPYAIAGHEDGFDSTVSKSGYPLIWVAGDNSVVQDNGTPNPTKISPPDLERLIAAVVNKNDLEASVYVAGGHPKWRLTCATWTWEFDIGSQKWNEVTSYGLTRTRAVGSHYAFGKWIVGDKQAGQLAFIDPTNYGELGNPLPFRIESAPIKHFPARTKVGRADFDFVTGVGIATGVDPTQTTPTVGISWSDDGISWSNQLVRSLGVQATTRRITVLRSGQSGVQGRRWRLDVSDAVYVAILGATQNTDLRHY